MTLLLGLSIVALTAFTPTPPRLVAPRHGPVCHPRTHRPPPLLAAPPASSAAVALPGGTPLTVALVAAWYFASVVCNQSSKVLLRSLGSQTLTLAQLVIAAACGANVSTE